MREIKFRAWLTQEQKIVDVYRLDFADKRGKPTLVMWYLMQTGTQVGLTEGFELLQFTGLYDAFHKEIYEGDILYDPMYRFIHAVRWNSDIGGFSLDNGLPLYKKITDYCEVIGNVYENPELLEQKKGGGNNE